MGAIRSSFRTSGWTPHAASRPASFRVRLRYGTQAEAAQALSAASVSEDNGNYYLVFNVPAVNRAEDKVEPADPPSEVRVDW